MMQKDSVITSPFQNPYQSNGSTPRLSMDDPLNGILIMDTSSDKMGSH